MLKSKKEGEGEEEVEVGKRTNKRWKLKIECFIISSSFSSEGWGLRFKITVFIHALLITYTEKIYLRLGPSVEYSIHTYKHTSKRTCASQINVYETDRVLWHSNMHDKSQICVYVPLTNSINENLDQNKKLYNWIQLNRLPSSLWIG